jgi:serine phosphatase RsbU (regulator of sigma subunit)/Tfp pilus assembly protein PilF
MKKAVLLVVLCISGLQGFGQDHLLDSLLQDFRSAKHDTTRASVYVQFSEILYLSKPDTVMPLCLKAIELCDKNIPKANDAEKRSFLLTKSSACNNIGYIYQNRGDTKLALDFYQRGLKIQEDIGDLKGLAQSLNNIGFVFQNQNDVPKTLIYYEKSLAIREKIGDKKGIAESLNNLGLVYRKNGDPNCKSQIKDACMRAGVQKALEYYLRSLKIKEEINDVNGIGISLNNIGGVYNFLKEYDKALEYFNKSLELRTKIGDKQGQSIALNNIGTTYFKKGDHVNAEKFCLRSMDLAKEIGFPENIRRTAESLKNIYKANGNSDKAMEMFELYIRMRDSINSREAQKEAEKQYFKLEYEKKAAADSVRVEQEKKVVSLQLEHKKNQSYFLIAGLLLVLIFAVFMFNRFKITQKQKHLIEIKEKETQQQKILIEDKQKEIVDSINYAQRIQKALLAGDNLLQENLPEHFVLYKPKAIVSGDFYWGHSVGSSQLAVGSNQLAESSEQFFLAVCDSTGHGVPGAFMSLLNISFLNEAVNERKIVSPSGILDHVRERIIQNLSTEGGKDGMDCSLAAFDFKNKKLRYAAANNEIWIVRKKELIELTGDKMPVGKHDKEKQPFAEHNVDLQNGDLVYLFTDGFADQFGGPKGKKFMYKQLQQLFIEISGLNVNEQKDRLDVTFENWKGKLEQVDDVCIIGVRI